MQHSNLFNFDKFHKDQKWLQLWKALFSILHDDKLLQFHVKALNCIRILTRDKDSLQQNSLEADMVCLLKVAKLIPKDMHSAYGITNEHSTENLLELLDAKEYHGGGRSDGEDDSIRTTESLKCLCNLVYQSLECRRQCIRFHIVDRLIQRISSNEHSVYQCHKSSSLELYDMKLLFLLSALETLVRSRLVFELNGLTYLMETLNEKLSITEEWAEQQIDIAIDLLKVMYNIVSHSEKSPPNEHEIQNLHLIGIIRRLLFRFGENMERNSIRLLISNCINLLIHMSATCLVELLVKLDQQQATTDASATPVTAFEGHNLYALNVLLNYLRLVADGVAVSSTISEQRTAGGINDALPPILSVLLKCAGSHRIMRHYLRHIILPPLKRVSQPPEVGNELRNQLCRLQSNCDQIVSELTSELLFICCKKNARRMVKYFGYGNMAGLFCRKGMLDCRRLDPTVLGELSTDSEEDSDTEEYKSIQSDINPITGFYHNHQYQDHQQEKDNNEVGRNIPNSSSIATAEQNAMTEEEKEYQAMQLVQVIDKLQRNGLITPCGIDEDGKLRPVEHILELQENGTGFIKSNSIRTSSASSLNDSVDPFTITKHSGNCAGDREGGGGRGGIVQ